MEEYQSITNEMKLNKISIDDNYEITFESFYSNIIPLLKKLESNTKEELKINYKNYVIKLIKNNSIFCEINLLKDNYSIKILERVFN